MAQQTVILNPGESKLVSFEATPTEAKTYQVSVNGLSGSFTATAPSGAGIISHIWMWYEGLASWGIVWTSPEIPIALIPGEIPLNGEIYLVPGWKNTSEVNMVGHIDLVVSYPDGSRRTLSATRNQDKDSAPGSGANVGFEPFTSSQEGTYTITVTLSSAGQVLDSVTFNLVARG